MEHGIAPPWWSSRILKQVFRVWRSWRYWKSSRLLRIIAVARTHGQAFPHGRQLQLAVLAAGIDPIRRVADAVLVPQLVLDLGVNPPDRVDAGNTERSAAGLPRKPLHRL